jgi:hypothetical protein
MPFDELASFADEREHGEDAAEGRGVGVFGRSGYRFSGEEPAGFVSGSFCRRRWCGARLRLRAGSEECRIGAASTQQISGQKTAELKPATEMSLASALRLALLIG